MRGQDNFWFNAYSACISVNVAARTFIHAMRPFVGDVTAQVCDFPYHNAKVYADDAEENQCGPFGSEVWRGDDGPDWQPIPFTG